MTVVVVIVVMVLLFVLVEGIDAWPTGCWCISRFIFMASINWGYLLFLWGAVVEVVKVVIVVIVVFPVNMDSP